MCVRGWACLGTRAPFTHLPISGHVGCFRNFSVSWILWIVLRRTWCCRYVFQILILPPSDIVPEVALGDLVVLILILFLQNLHTVFQSGCTDFHAHRQCAGGPFSPYSCPHSLSLGYFSILNEFCNQKAFQWTFFFRSALPNNPPTNLWTKESSSDLYHKLVARNSTARNVLFHQYICFTIFKLTRENKLLGFLCAVLNLERISPLPKKVPLPCTKWIDTWNSSNKSLCFFLY